MPRISISISDFDYGDELRGPPVNGGFGSQPEVSDGYENVGLWGRSGSRFRAAGGLLVATCGHGDPVIAKQGAELPDFWTISWVMVMLLLYF